MDAADEAIALAPNNPDALSARGLALLRIGRLDEARSTAEDTVRISPTNVLGHLIPAIILERHGAHQHAEAAYRQTLELAPLHLGALTNYANLLLKLDRLAEAEALLDRCDGLGSELTAVIWLRGELALRRGRCQEAEERARWVLSIDATHRGATALLARSQMRWFNRVQHGIGRFKRRPRKRRLWRPALLAAAIAIALQHGLHVDWIYVVAAGSSVILQLVWLRWVHVAQRRVETLLRESEEPVSLHTDY